IENPHHELVPKEEKEGIEGMDKEGVIKLKGNKFPKGLVSLEDLFEKHDRFIQVKENQSSQCPSDFDQENIGTSDNPRMVNI
ncbi:hypothetical protein KI387_040163, partial [Taxus chinensis]